MGIVAFTPSNSAFHLGATIQDGHACQAAFESNLLSKPPFAVYIGLMMHSKVHKV